VAVGVILALDFEVFIFYLNRPPDQFIDRTGRRGCRFVSLDVAPHCLIRFFVLTSTTTIAADFRVSHTLRLAVFAALNPSGY